MQQCVFFFRYEFDIARHRTAEIKKQVKAIFENMA